MGPGRRGLIAGGAALVLGVLTALTYSAVGGETGGASALNAFATSSASPGGTGPAPAPGPSVSASPSPSPSPSLSPSPSASPSPTPSPSYSPTVTPTITAPTTKPPTTPPPSPKPTVVVGAVSVTVRQTGTSLGQATVAVKASGNAPVTVVLEWFTGDAEGKLGRTDGAPDTLTYQPGAAPLVQAHTFSGTGCYWGVRATTKPAAGNGSSTSQVFIRRCTIS